MPDHDVPSSYELPFGLARTEAAPPPYLCIAPFTDGVMFGVGWASERTELGGFEISPRLSRQRDMAKAEEWVYVFGDEYGSGSALVRVCYWAEDLVRASYRNVLGPFWADHVDALEFLLSWQPEDPGPPPGYYSPESGPGNEIATTALWQASLREVHEVYERVWNPDQ